jgi:hypothetical protein
VNSDGALVEDPELLEIEPFSLQAEKSNSMIVIERIKTISFFDFINEYLLHGLIFVILKSIDLSCVTCIIVTCEKKVHIQKSETIAYIGEKYCLFLEIVAKIANA